MKFNFTYFLFFLFCLSFNINYILCTPSLESSPSSVFNFLTPISSENPYSCTLLCVSIFLITSLYIYGRSNELELFKQLTEKYSKNISFEETTYFQQDYFEKLKITLGYTDIQAYPLNLKLYKVINLFEKQKDCESLDISTLLSLLDANCFYSGMIPEVLNYTQWKLILFSNGELILFLF